jgi:hypothetical protein
MQQVFDSLLEQVPEFKPTYDEHLADYDGLLPHVLMGELFVFASDAYARGEIVLLARIVNFINWAASSGDDDVRNVVHASFIEEVPHSSLDEVVRPLLNDAAKKMYQAVLDYERAS